MSESINTRENGAGFHRQLLTTVSAIALLASICGSGEAQAENADTDRPILWIELGAQFEGERNPQETYLPPFMNPAPSFVTISPSAVQSPQPYSFGGEGKIEFQPQDSDWVFSAAVRYGRSNGDKHQHQQTSVRLKSPFHPSQYISVPYSKFADAAAHEDASHTILDFGAGKDVGLGMFGQDSRSMLSAGIRYAQFTNKSRASVAAVPTLFGYVYNTRLHVSLPFQSMHNFQATEQSERNFRGIGPSLSWDSSADIVRSGQAQFTFDWGANAAVLFGRQKVRVHERTVEYIDHPSHATAYNNALPDRIRSKTVTVPNIGGFAGVSLKFPNAKFSIGYRGDFFFGAMDGGLDQRETENVSFYGPFASISVGIGG